MTRIPKRLGVGLIAITAGVGAMAYLRNDTSDEEKADYADARGEPTQPSVERTPPDVDPADRLKAWRRRQQQLRSRRHRPGGRPSADELGSPTDIKLAPAYLQARQRDKQRFDAETLAAIDGLYRLGMSRDDPKSLSTLETLARTYPTSNRGGCAAMNLAARLLEGDDTDGAVAWLTSLVERNTDAVFASGEAVLPKAMFLLGKLKVEQGDTPAADVLFGRMEREFADTVDGEGVPYTERLDDVRAGM